MAQMVPEQQLSFARGMNDTSAPTEYLPDECELVQNGRISFDGQTIERRGGSEKMHSTALDSGSQCYGAIEYHTAAAGVQQLVVFMGDKMYTSITEGATWVEQASGLTEAYWSIVIMREGAANVLCCANGGTNSYQWDGTTWATISNIPNDVKYLAVFGDRLYATGHSGITIVASKVGDLEVYATPDGLSIRAQTHDGDTEMTGLYALGSVLLAFKENSVGYIEGFGFNTLEVETGARGISRSVGCVAFRTIQAVGDQGVCWLSKRGIEFYQLGGPVTLVSRSIQNFIDGVNWSQLSSTPGTAVGMWWPQKHEYWCALPVSADQNDWMVGYRPPHGQGNQTQQPAALMLHKYAATADDTLYTNTTDGYLELSTAADRDQGDTLFGYLIHTATGGQFMAIDASGYLDFAAALHDHAAIFLADVAGAELTTSPISCGYDGFVRQLEKGDTDNATTGADDGEVIAFKVVTRPFFFGQPMRQKKARIIRVASQQAAVGTWTVRVVADGNDGTTHAVTTEAATKPLTVKARVGKKGVAIQAEITTNDDMKLSAVEMAAKMLAEPW
jgi:hypothetical protein|tara:strand:- start:4660 stop:6339 length:1680 start_codon:yes stop_codon:yes gene_type:complete